MRHYVDVFIGQSRAQGWIRTLESYGFGEMVQPSEFPPRRLPYAFDCQRFGMWQRGEQGDAEKEAKWRTRYEQALDAVWRYNHRPEVLIVPDFIADWQQSAAMTLEWLPRVRKHGPPYLSVQDGAEVCEVANLLKEHDFSGIFVGGSLAWKIRTGATWVTLAHGAGRKCHIGRVGTEQRVRWALRIGARLHRFVSAALERRQPTPVFGGIRPAQTRKHAAVCRGGDMRKTEQEARKRRVLEAMSRDKLTPAQVFERFGVPVKTLELWRREQREAA